MVQIGLERVHGTQPLCLAHKHYPALCHHGIGVRALHYLVYSGLVSVHEIEVEVLLLGFEKRMHDEMAQTVYIIGFLAHQIIYGRHSACAQVSGYAVKCVVCHFFSLSF